MPDQVTRCGLANVNAKANPDWFTEALRAYMLKVQMEALEVEEDVDWIAKRGQYVDKIIKAKTFGALMNILYYDYELYNDVSMIISDLEATGKEVVS